MVLSALGFPIGTVVFFVILSVVALAVDLFAHRHHQAISLKSAVWWSVFWVAISCLFGGYIWWHHGSEMGSLFFTGYALEKVLSVDNLFVMMAIFTWFKIPDALRHRVLYWGIVGAMVFRLIFVAIGTSLLALGAWVELVFAALVAWSAYMMLHKDTSSNAISDYSEHLAYRWVHRFFPVFPRLHQHYFFLRGKTLMQARAAHPSVMLEPATDSKHKMNWVATPLFLCLAVIELTDVMFAFDSVPAVIAVSREPLIVYSAMIFAILGLRTLYFVLEALKQYLCYLEDAVIILLFFIAFKLVLAASNHFLHHGYQVSANASLVVVLLVLVLGVVASFVFPQNQQDKSEN